MKIKVNFLSENKFEDEVTCLINTFYESGLYLVRGEYFYYGDEKIIVDSIKADSKIIEIDIV